MESFGEEKRNDLAPEEVADLGEKIREAAEKLAVPAPAEKEPVLVIFPETPSKPEAVPLIVPETGPKPVEVKPEENIPANIAVAPEMPAKPERRPQSGSVLSQEERERIFGKSVSKKPESAPAERVLVSAEEAEEFGLEPERPVVAEKPKENKEEKPAIETKPAEKREEAKEAPETEKSAGKLERKEESQEEKSAAEKELVKDVYVPVVLTDAQSKNIFRHLSDYAQGVFEGLRHVVPDRVALSYNRFWGERYDRRLQSKTQEHQDLRKAIDKVNELIHSSDEAVQAMRKDGVEIGVDRIETYKKDLEYQKAVLDSDEGSLMRKINGIGKTRGEYFKKRDSICERLTSVYDGRIKIIEEESQKAEEMTQLLEQQIREKRLQKDKIRDRLKTLEDRLAENKLPFFAKEIKKAIKLANKTLRGTEKLIQEEEAVIKKSNERVGKIKKKRESYKSKQEGYKKVIKKQGAGVEASESQDKEAGRAEVGTSSAEGGAGVEKNKKVGEGIRKYLPADLVKKWNSVNSGVLRIDEEKIKPLFAEEAWLGGTSYAAFGEAIHDYMERLPEDTEENVKIKRSIIKNKKKIEKRRGWLGSILGLNI